MYLLYFSNENYAEKLFAEMSEKDGGTYGAMIRGLVRVSTCCMILFTFMITSKL